jgi:hypothetical protein
MTMADDNPDVREIGRIEDDQGRVVIVGVNGDEVTLRTLGTRTSGAVTLAAFRAEEFAQLYTSACWQAGWHQGRAGTERT